MLYSLLYPLHDHYAFLNVFRYITFRAIYATLTALIISFLLGPYLIRVLRGWRIGQQIRDVGPQSHQVKSGTPTMGGILILIAILLSTLLWADLKNRYIWLVIFTTFGFGLIGFWDDYLKVVRKKSEGLLPRYKFGFQLILAIMIAVFLLNSPAYSSKLYFPFFKHFTPDLGWLYLPLVVFIIVGASNAVNLTDGLDGLAIGPIIVTSVAYLIVAYISGNHKFADYLLIPYIEGSGELSVFCGAIIGAGLGFLWFNAYPASVFMGDVGSLPIGGALGTVAVVSKHELLLLLVGGIFVIEALSVITQVISFKTRGKRVFLMSPIHHHFELKGWHESKVVIRFWIIAIILALLSLSTLKLR
ncbi:MAG: phospho-N-acetylmuramoyl-pentapeptide-transferase [Nitrospirae bacterium]|jgi:phospho-N-acetylmuramoyl-pentapeptide-transferase|nr:phospho-N-acetylmuramoyl-pentapeptide-transferase [Nitrospirota bacterium]MBI3605442.1 phospho-N-acetylmuramoyl-pentapeptide-transferase [Nitrospirota bacterium]